MFAPGRIKSILIFAFILLSALRGNVYAVVYADAPAEKREILKSEILLETKGIIETTPEVCNGGSFQNSLYKLKHSFGNHTSFSVKERLTTAFIIHLHICRFEAAKTPIYLFNRSILI